MSAWWKCWRCDAQNVPAAVSCENCGAERASNLSPMKPVAEKCRDCSAIDRLNTFANDTLVVEDRGARLCASCWIPALRRRADADRKANTGPDGVYHCSEPGCTSTVQQHIEQAKAAGTSVAWLARFASTRDEAASHLGRGALDD